MNRSLLFLTTFLLFASPSLASQEIEEEKEGQALSDKSSYKSLPPPPDLFNRMEEHTLIQPPKTIPRLSLLVSKGESSCSFMERGKDFLDVPQSPRKKRSFSIDLNLGSASYDIVLKEDIPKSYSVIEKEDCEFYQSFHSQRSIPAQGCWNGIRQWFCCFLPQAPSSERFLPLSSSEKLFRIVQSSSFIKKD